MSYLKYTPYPYLIFAIFFIYDGITKINTTEIPWFSFFIAALGIFMFFFRRRFAKKIEDEKRNRKP